MKVVHTSALAAALLAAPVAHAFGLSSASTSPLFRAPSARLLNSRSASKLRVATNSLSVNNDAISTNEPPVEAAVAETPAKAQPEFNWYKQWYPIVPVEFLDPEKPQHFKLLNIDLVVWNDGHVAAEGENGDANGGVFGSKKERAKGAQRVEGNYRVFEDSCPHRKAPLSEGRVEDDGTILCSYHAWRWDGEGDLCSVPQAQSDDEFGRIRSNPKSSCNSYPAKVLNGVLWVWPESGSDARIESELTPVQMMPLPHEEDPTIDEGRVFAGTWNFRELPYGHDFFLENVVDPAHVPSSHHNVVGNRYRDTNPLFVSTSQPVTKDGFEISVRTGSNDDSVVPSTTKFSAPSLVQIKAPVGEGAIQILELYSSPSRPGFCNHVGRQVIVKGESGETPTMLKAFMTPMPKWLNHVLAGLFLNQDALFLHAQERMLHEKKEYSTNIGEDDEPYHYSKAVLPMTADKGVVNFRSWLRNKAGGRIPYRGNPEMPATSNEVVFDIYSSHTKHCKNCLAALKNLRKARFISYLAAAFVAALRPAKLGAVGSTALAGLLGGVGLGLGKLIHMMHRLEYSHAEND